VTALKWNEDRPLLEIQDLHAAGYDPAIEVLRGASMHVREGEIVCVVGPNGAGKSTLLRALYGLVPVRRGRVLFDDRDITNIRPAEALHSAGIALVPQYRSVFPEMTVQENLTLGLYLQRDRVVARSRLAYAYDMFPQLRAKARQVAGQLAVAERRMLEVARALMWRPRLVLIDELSSGLTPTLAASIFAELRRMSTDAAVTILVAEQNARLALAISDRGYVLELGRQIFEGTKSEMLSSVAVRRSLLGTSERVPASDGHS
jgi:ABC-type branched-subunit amino acid transport system ATPase component